MAQGKDILNFSTWIVQVRDALSSFITRALVRAHTRTHARTHALTHAHTHTHKRRCEFWTQSYRRKTSSRKVILNSRSVVTEPKTFNWQLKVYIFFFFFFFFTRNVEHVTVTANWKCLACKTELLHFILTDNLECFTLMGNAGPRKHSDCWRVSVIRTRYS